ncbi:hypothetical protein GWO43_16485 [candidate division KSB1 bacterium]|nr:hypothetical protein [candidate division KSB1 bacterium]NIR68731.1 hypothetical protein [candidate division KSB1 bacterium]NIS25548.1 hypothetical protein [candidate division KSB1 bacterium]NIT72441.1 hypothetical protein [candidate division KSB1 bacterium]NIU26225.1 hypothetical protein [candidate division KSB1 bacterium]
MKTLSLFSLLLVLLPLQQLQAQSEAAVLFMLIQPSTRANGMAGASVASAEHDALSVAFNPAHIGLAAMDRSLHAEFYPSKTNWLPGFGIEGLTFEAGSILLGYNFRRLNESIPVSVGFGYSKVRINLGEQVITDETGPEPIATFSSSEEADIWSVGVGLDYFVKLGFGFNFKSIESNLSSVGAGAEIGTGRATANVHDFGVLLHWPILQTISELSENSFEILIPGLHPFLMPGFGYSKSNIGDSILFENANQADPLPRVARMALSVNTGLMYSTATIDLGVLSFEWSSEAEDGLVTRDPDGSFEYEGGLGDIDVFDNVLGGNADQNVQNTSGWELEFLDVFAIRRGSLDDVGGSRLFDADGYGISLSGALKLARILSPKLYSSRILTFVQNHFDIQYDHSSFDGSALDGTEFDSIRVSFF